MLEFLKFIWQSVLISSHIGFGVFFFIEAVCVFIGAALLWKKHKAEKWEEWQELAMKTAFAILLILFIVSTLFVAPFIQYRESDVAKNEQRAATERDDPTAFENIKPLLDRLTQIDAAKSTNTVQKSIWNKTDEITALKDEIELTK
jgi:hypothetical protein